MDINSFQFNTQTFLAPPEQDLVKMISSGCSFDSISLCKNEYEDEETLRDINPDDLSEWTDCEHLLEMELDNELNFCDLSEDIFSDAHAVTGTSPIHPKIDFNHPQVLEFALNMSNLSMSIQRSEVTRAAIRQHRNLFLEQKDKYFGLSVRCVSPVCQGNMNEIAKIDYSRAQYLEKFSRMSNAA